MRPRGRGTVAGWERADGLLGQHKPASASSGHLMATLERQAADTIDGSFGSAAPNGESILGRGDKKSGGTVHGAAAPSSVGACVGRRSRVGPTWVS